MIRFNHHTHSLFCDGAAAPEAYVEEALRQDFHTLGFSSHAPVPFENNFALTDEHVEEYQETIRKLQQKYADRLEIFLGLEIDFIPGMTRDFDFYRRKLGLDYVIGGVHLVRRADKEQGLWFIDGPSSDTYDKGLKEVFDQDIRKGVQAYFNTLCEMIVTQKPDIVAHMDKIKMHNGQRFFKEDEPWYVALVDQTVEVLAQSGCIVEINTRGIYKKRCPDLFPSVAILKKLKQNKVAITVSSDAHDPSELTLGMDIAYSAAIEAGYHEVMCLQDGNWQLIEIDK